MKKKITLDDLAAMVAQGFAEMGGKIDGIESRLIGVDGTLQGLKTDIERIDLRLSQAAWQIDYRNLDERVTVLEQKAGIKQAVGV
ncbi:MAG: hypothetical protein UY92_C0001G0078 [Candidatus Magasanikbacteria bacterium GW2011_GWA2_56_11]|uniref:Uncharacterized protein n=1 Tax=Candidatus Magasanikbacteria bacterium GW2011_GWA2_56_11 TaxID=1619044 RepID=A0A0G2BBX3_9BACT|nr:MAG: hypothetical protein UY92_C0001G0078 [Candidatus Magasanikbacteria bacterium GW2011_GWA2_56_11]